MNLITPSEGFFTRYIIMTIVLIIFGIIIGSLYGFDGDWSSDTTRRILWISIPIIIISIIGLVIKKIVGRPI